MNKLLPYSLATLGPVASAGAQFLMSLVLLRTLPGETFGAFAFLLVVSQVSTGLLGAIACAPLPVILHTADKLKAAQLVAAASAVAMVFAGASSACVVGFGIALSLPVTASICFGLFNAWSCVRWFARAHAYALGIQRLSAISDCVYSGVLLLGVGLALTQPEHTLLIACIALAISSAAGLFPFGSSQLASYSLSVRPNSFRCYREIWHEHSKWALIGVVTTEATGNAHTWIVSALAGVRAFAPLAASALLIRPITVLVNALSEFERPHMAKQFRARDFEKIENLTRTFRFVLVAAWILNTGVCASLLLWSPHTVYPAYYSIESLTVGAALWSLVLGVRVMRTPESVLLQASGQFRPLANASLVSSVVALLSVTLITLWVGPIWSLAGILLGEASIAAFIWFQVRISPTLKAPPLQH